MYRQKYLLVGNAAEIMDTEIKMAMFLTKKLQYNIKLFYIHTFFGIPTLSY